MKRIVALMLILVFCFACVSLAETQNVENMSDEEIAQMLADLQAELDSRGKTDETEAAEAEEQTYTVLQKGDKNDTVKELQIRLIELNYLSGGADGDFGGKTEAAVKMFQKDSALEATGIADAQMQEKLFAEDAPKAKVYNNMNFKEISRDPNAYSGEYYKFSGKVLQVMEGSDSYGTTSTVLRIATKGNYDDVVYVTYERPNTDKRILEDDKVTVYGVCEGLYTYETIMGGSITLPKFNAETISFD